MSCRAVPTSRGVAIIRKRLWRSKHQVSAPCQYIERRLKEQNVRCPDASLSEIEALYQEGKRGELAT